MEKYIELYLSGMSIPEVSSELSIPLSTLRFRLKKAGVLRTRAEGIRSAASRGRMSSNKGIKREFTEEWKKNISASQIKRHAGIAKGISKKPSGYIEITVGENKGRLQHSVVAEKKIGRRLMSNECVHHINGKRDDNRPENLSVMTRSEHARLHRLQESENKKCQ